MILRIARREFTQSLRDGRLIGAGALVLLLLLTALLVGWQRHADNRAERVTAQELDYDDWLSQPARHPHDAAHQGLHVFKPDMPLSMIDPGVTPYVGSTLWLQAHRQSEVKFRPAQDATGLQRFGSFSPAWILQVLGPLLVIILGFDVFTAEREQGTLRQLLSLGVTPRRLLAGKATALGSVLTLLFVPFVIVAVIAVLTVAAESERVDLLLRLSSLGIGYALYLGAFIGLVLAASAWARSSRLSLTVLLGIWIAVAVLAPRAIADASRSWFPSESRREFDARLGADLGEQSQRAWEELFGKDSGTVYGTKVPLSRWGMALQTQDQAGYTVMDRHFARLWDSYERQQAVQEWFGILIPTLAIRGYSMRVAGTDFEQHRAFSVAAEQHRRKLQDLVSHDLVEHADGRDEAHFSYRAGPELWREVPPFDFRVDTAGAALRHAARSATVLVLALLAVWIVALLATRRLLK
jgi:ABC-2 type transport system permease protein